MEGSGWNLQGIIYLKIYFHKTNALNGMTYIKFSIRTNSILNIQNVDTYCFLWCILANIHPVDNHPYRVSKYETYRGEINITNIDFTNGMRIVDITGFEILNPTLSISVSENAIEKDNDYKLVPLYTSKHNEKQKNYRSDFIQESIYIT